MEELKGENIPGYSKDERSRKEENKKERELFFEKQYVLRDSILTEKLSQPDIQTVYNMFLAILVSLLINTIINDYIVTGEINFGQKLIKLGFYNVQWAFLLWIFLNILVYFTYGCFLCWATVRTKLLPRTALFWDKIWLSMAVIYFASLFYFVQKVMSVFEFAPGSIITLLAEHVRLVMKQYSFLRENIPKVKSYKPHSDQDLTLPKIGQLAYFIFAPVMIYKDEYPRTKSINWKFALQCVAEVFSIILFISLLIERYLKHSYSEFCLRKFTWQEMVLTTLTNLFPGIMFMFLGFYSILHATQNAFAEILRFGDRQFYKEWWQCKSLSKFYRTWNILVQDWLFRYIYKDFYLYIFPKRKTLSLMSVFLISAIVHEWIISISFGIFLPIQSSQLFFTATFLACLGLLNKNLGNITLWYFIALGASIQISFYSIEFFARKNCPVENPKFIDFFKFRFLTCDCE